jgi:hypothetical protein
MSTLFEIFHNIQQKIFPWLEGELDPLTEKEQQFIQVVSLMDLGKHIKEYRWRGVGRKRKERDSIAKAFVAKAIYNFETTEILVEYLKGARISGDYVVGTQSSRFLRLQHFPVRFQNFHKASCR